MSDTILFADTDGELCELYQRFFLQRGYEVETARDGLECLTKLQQRKPAVLILELELPWGGADGVLGCMEEETSLSSIPVIIIGTNSPPAALSADHNPLVYFSLLKPFRFDDLLASIRAALGIHAATACGAGGRN